MDCPCTDTSNSKTIAPSSLECDDYDRESCLHVRNVRVFLDNSNGEKLSEQLKGGTDLNQCLNEIVKRITVDSITENKLTLKFFLDEDPDGSSDLISPISATLQAKEKEINKEIFSNNNLFSFGSGDEASCETQKILQEFNTSVFISVSTQTDNNFCSKETQCDIIGDKKILGENSEPQKHDEKIILNFCKHNCCSVPDTSAKLQRLISFYLVQDEAVFSKCIVREIGTQTEDIELSVNIKSISQLFDGPLTISKSHVNVENGGWMVAQNESLKIKEYFDRKGFDKVLEDSIIFKNIVSQDGSKDEDQDRYSSFGFSPDSEVDEVFHAENTEEEKVSLYFESRLEQRKGEAKSKRYKEPPQSSFEKTTSRAIKNRFLEDEPDFEVLQPIEELNFHNAYIVKKSYPVDSAKITFSSPPWQTESSVEVLTLCFSKLRSRRICPTLKLPIYFRHFLRSKLFKIQSPQRASVNPVLLTEVILQYPSNQSLEPFELKKETITSCVCLEVLREAGLKRQTMIQRKFNSEEENINDFTQYEEISPHSSPFVSICYFYLYWSIFKWLLKYKRVITK
nr:uncharacterized protein LOC107436213 [Parasteatoda tepidariorum]